MEVLGLPPIRKEREWMGHGDLHGTKLNVELWKLIEGWFRDGEWSGS